MRTHCLPGSERKIISWALGPVLAFAVCPAGLSKAQETQVPETPRGEEAFEFHGARVPDPYRWLERPGRSATPGPGPRTK